MATPRDLRLLAYFVQIVRAGSIRGAAAQLSLSPAVLSEALANLEELVGVTLLQRTTRSMALTDTGSAVFEQAAAAVAAADQAMILGDRGDVRPTGTVRITLPVELSISWFPGLLRSFEAGHSDLRVEVNADDEMISLQASVFDIAIRTEFDSTGEAGDDACLRAPLELVCAPTFGEALEGSLEARLARLGMIGSSSVAQGRRRIMAYPRVSKRQRGRGIEVRAPSRFSVNSQVVAHRLAQEGFGAALLIGLTVAGDLATGRLIRVDEGYDYGFVVGRILMRDRYPTPAARALRDHLLQ